MKKRIIGILLSSVMMFSMMGGMAYAASPEATEAGVYDLKILNNSVTVAPMTADRTVISAKNVLIDGQETEEYEGAERFQVSVSNTADQKFYLVIAKDEDAAPTEKNLKYIDQKTSADGSVIFDVYPAELASGKTYYISLSNNEDNSSGLVNIASFKYYEAYKLGDIDKDGEVTVVDAMMALQYSVDVLELSKTEFLAGDVDKDGEVTVVDAMLILQYSVDIISNFD